MRRSFLKKFWSVIIAFVFLIFVIFIYYNSWRVCYRNFNFVSDKEYYRIFFEHITGEKLNSLEHIEIKRKVVNNVYIGRTGEIRREKTISVEIHAKNKSVFSLYGVTKTNAMTDNDSAIGAEFVWLEEVSRYTQRIRPGFVFSPCGEFIPVRYGRMFPM